jgi:hypothetical protein
MREGGKSVTVLADIKRGKYDPIKTTKKEAWASSIIYSLYASTYLTYLQASQATLNVSLQVLSSEMDLAESRLIPQVVIKRRGAE